MKKIVYIFFAFFLLIPINVAASSSKVSFGYVPSVNKFDYFALLFYVENLSCLKGNINFDPDVFYNGGYTYGNGWSDFNIYPAGTITIDSCCETCTSKQIIDKTEMYHIDLWVKGSARTFPSSTITFTPIYAEDINGNSVEVNSLSSIARQTDYSNPSTILSPNNNLVDIIINEWELSPAFNKTTLEYNLTVPYKVTEVPIIPRIENSLAKYKVSGNKNLQVGINTTNIEVTAQNGKIKNYKINITRQPISNNNNLKMLNTKTLFLNENFYKDLQDYTVTVPYKTNELTIYATSEDENATINIIGNHNFVVGDNVVVVEVTSEDSQIKQYKIKVTRQEKSSNNNLKRIVIEELDRTINVYGNRTDYGISFNKKISEVTLNVTSEDENATVKIEKSYMLKQNDNKITIEVIAENGESKSYTINLKKQTLTLPIVLTIGLPIIGIFLFIVIYINRSKRKVINVLKTTT